LSALRHLRYILSSVVFTLFIFSSVLYTACSNKCGSLTCQNGGSCSGNKCVCPTGYYGNSCETGWSNACIGTYNCSRSGCSPAVTGAQAWVSKVSKASANGGYTVYISNFDNVSGTIVATIDSTQNITIVPASGAVGINAKGTYADGKIKLHFTSYTTGGGGFSCDMLMVKQ
jgi:hypothetical protein